jgi:O-antigen/teichoic acid export membrane protein
VSDRPDRGAGEAPDVLDTTAAGPMVIQGGILRALGYGASTLLALVGIAMVTRHLGVADFGRFQTVIALITVVGTLTDSGMATLGLREFSQRTGSDRDEMMRSLLGLRVGLTLLGVGVAALLALALATRNWSSARCWPAWAWP